MTRSLVRLWLRSTALALAVAATAGQLSSVAHMLLVPHAMCPEHGALVHLATDAAHASQRSNAVHSEYRDAGGVVEGDQHEHCLSDAIRRAACLVASAVSSKLPAGALACATFVAARDHAEQSVDLLSVAPKSSPPATRA